MTDPIYEKAKAIKEDLAELERMLNSIPYPDKDTRDIINIGSPKLKAWLKNCIEAKIAELNIEFRELG